MPAARALASARPFPTDWYLPETLDQDLRILQEQLIPPWC